MAAMEVMNKRDQKRKMWRARVKAWRCSGLMQSEYCRHNHLNQQQFSYWKNIFDSDQQSRPGAFVPVPVPMLIEPPPAPQSNSGIIVRLANGIGIELSSDFTATTLIKAVAALGGGR